MKIIYKFALLCTIALISTSVIAKELLKFTSNTKKVSFTLSTFDEKLPKIPFNKITPLTLSAKIEEPTKVLFNSFDCRMPDHDHGMVTKPKITKLEDGKWRIDGFKLHMMGEWEYYFWININGEDEKVSIKQEFK